MVGLEIKREIVVAELSCVEKAMVPVRAASGGALVSAAIYGWLNNGNKLPSIGQGINGVTVS
jgi:NhaA family Na+:H+ antiporter